MAEIDQSYEPEEPQDDDLDAVLSTVAAQGEGEILVKFYKFDKGRGNWIFDAHAVDMPDIMNRIKEEYGGGDYEAVVRRGNRIATRKRFSIMVATRPKEEPRGNSNEMQVILQGMNQLGGAITELGKMMVEMRQTPAAPAVSPMAQMTEMIGLMTAMQSLIPKPPQVNPMEQFKQTMELATMLAENMNGGPAEQTPGQLLTKLTSDLAPVLTAALSRPTAPIVPQTRVPVTKPNAISAPTPQPKPATTGTDPDMLMKMMLQRPVAQLLQLAASGVPAADCAGPVLDQVPETYIEKFVTFIEKPTAVDELISINPQVSQHREWFSSLIAEMLRELTEEDSPTTIAGSETGIATDADPDNFSVNGNS